MTEKTVVTCDKCGGDMRVINNSDMVITRDIGVKVEIRSRSDTIAVGQNHVDITRHFCSDCVDDGVIEEIESV